MTVPTPIAEDYFWNRSGRSVRTGDRLRVSSESTADVVDRGSHIGSDVFVVSMADAAPDCVVRCEVCLPHALQWVIARRSK